MWTTILISLGVLVLLFVLIMAMYVKAPPSVAYILSGVRKEPRVLIGTGGIKIPIFERLDKVFLGQVTVDVKTNKPVPTRDFINVNVDAVTKVRVNPSLEGIRLAAKNFLNMNEASIADQIQDSLEGNMRECIGSLSLEAINTDRDAFSDQIQTKATPDMAKLGLEILSCNIQNVTDDNNLIRDLGADNTFSIKKNAAITKANAERDMAIAESKAKKEANDVRAKAETEIAERNNELEIRKAELKKQSDSKKAEADAAYKIQEQEQQKTLNVKTVEAESAYEILRQEQQKVINAKTVEAAIEKTRQEKELTDEQIKVTQNKLQAEINAQADADKYQTEIAAEALLQKEKRNAEAEAYKAEQIAKAVKAKAEASKYAALQEAEGIKARGAAEAEAKRLVLEAEAAGIQAKGLAEAEAMQKKAEAYEKYGQVAVIDMISKMYQSVLPDMAKNIADPMSKIGDITIYGSNGNEAAGISGNVPVVLKQALDTVKDSTGIDLKDLVDAHSKSAKTDKNIKIDGNGATVKVLNE